MNEYSEKVIIDEDEIKRRVAELVISIADDCPGGDLVVIGILKGSFIFLADMLRLMYLHNLRPQVDFMILSSYGSSTIPSTMIKIERDLSVNIEGKFALVVDDILDTGRTMLYVKERLKWLEPKMIKTCVLLDKPARRKVEMKADYVGFEVEDRFVVGYGLDFNGYYRERPYVAVLEEQPEAE
ncbi:MAG: hypoxanthine phosphoribosyltransferase [candidate division Zixibacteria bacterium]|nr:hypoxanthine phosphoribosyltransferase [Candidatus Tariuqbacter arcticus]